MKISVAIPTYNSAKFIAATLDSVLGQSRAPDEILVLDDGSTDETAAILNSYGTRISVLLRANRGVAAARTELCQRATGDLIAFLDHDDIWHPEYLQVQGREFERHSKASGFFTLHMNNYGYGAPDWTKAAVVGSPEPQVIAPASFVERYNSSTGSFYSMSFCCIPKWTLERLGDAPFSEAVTGVDDCYIHNLLPLHGPIVFTPVPLVAYRVTPGAQSRNQLRNFQMVVRTFELLTPSFRAANDATLLYAFNLAFAGKRRRYGKTLMGAGRVAEARQQFKSALNQTPNPASMAKSASLLCLSLLPSRLQPRWPSSARPATS